MIQELIFNHVPIPSIMIRIVSQIPIFSLSARCDNDLRILTKTTKLSHYRVESMFTRKHLSSIYVEKQCPIYLHDVLVVVMRIYLSQKDGYQQLFHI